MGASFLITLLEGLEIALIMSILLAYLNTIGRRDRHGSVWAGALSAAAVSIAAGLAIFFTAGSLSHTAQEAFEGIVSFFAVGVLTWMIFWMRRQAGFIKGELEQRVDVALASSSVAALGLLAFFVVLREGLETALFLFATFRAATAGSTAASLLGAAMGFLVAAALGYLMYRGGVRLNLRTFFKVTGALVLLVAAGLLASGIHELQEVGWLPFGTGTAFDIRRVMPDSGPGLPLRALFGYNADPSWLEFLSWAAYLVAVGFFFFRPQPRPAAIGMAEPVVDRSA
ncbi:MAG TPA: iron uptake transporter permease EfeU [Actinomycetota bacterium]|nr:iron uptake transporter permease EfeU [Actinomycetota bacterium]